MAPDPDYLKRLLDETVPDAADVAGPSLGSVLRIVREERGRRARVRWSVGAASCVALLAAWLNLFPQAEVNPPPRGDSLSASRQPTLAPREAVARPEPAVDAPVVFTEEASRSVVIRQIDDDQLLALLEGTPAALVEWPNGDRSLLLVQRER